MHLYTRVNYIITQIDCTKKYRYYNEGGVLVLVKFEM